MGQALTELDKFDEAIQSFAQGESSRTRILAHTNHLRTFPLSVVKLATLFLTSSFLLQLLKQPKKRKNTLVTTSTLP